ncbi:MAG: hypothetical protein ACXVKO_14520 [Bacteriovorax sp.]
MNKLTKMLPAFCLLMQMGFVHAETSKTIGYENQKQEIFDLENWLKETTYTTEEVKDTCHRDVPHQEKVCKDVTKHKKECADVPAHQECKDVNHPICHTETSSEQQCSTPTHKDCHTETSPVCHNETRYENVCSTSSGEQQCRTVNDPSCHYETRYDNQCTSVPGEQECRVVIRYHEECDQTPGGHQCHQVPPDIQCHIVNGENKCEKIPAHEECTDTTGQRVCRQAPFEERECSAGSPRQECHQVPRQEQVCENNSRQECTTVPGSQQCHQEAHQEQVCSTSSHQECVDVPDDEICRQVPVDHQVCVDNMQKECKDIPAKNVCKKVSYKENVCKMETHTVDEAYECTKTVQVPHETLVKTHKAHVQMNFDARSKEVASEFSVALDTDGTLSLSAEDTNNSDLLIFAKKDIKSAQTTDINTLSAVYNIVLMNKAEFFKFMQSGIQNLALQKRSMSFMIAGKIEAQRASLAIAIAKKDEAKFEKTITGAQFTSEFDGTNTKITVDLEKFGAPKLGGIFNREHNVQLKLKLDYSDLGESILSKAPEFSTAINANVKVE